VSRHPLFLLSAIFIGELAVSACYAQQAQSDQSIRVESSTVPVVPGSIGQTLHVTVGHSLFFDAQAPLSRVYVDNPAVLESYAATPRQVVVSGLVPGIATIVLWDVKGANTAYSVVVDVDVARLQEAYENQFPMDKILVSADQSDIILHGYVASKEEFTLATKLAAGFGKTIANSLRIAPPHLRQVRLSVKFAEVDRTKAAQMGFSLLSMGQTIGMTSTGQFQAFQAPTISTSSSTISETVNTPLNLLLYNQNLNIGAAIQDMASKQVLEILAEPTITALSGHTGTFLAGGEFPFPMVQGGMSGQVSVSVQFMPYGVSLNFLPVVLDDGTIRLHVAPEVSALDYTNEVEIDGYTIPAISTRRAETDIELRDGQTFALTGLLDRRITDQFEQMPGFASIPILGMLFRSKNLQHSTSELLVIVTPHIIDEVSHPDDAAPKAPSPVVPYMANPSFDKSFNGKK
jgi:pilus assembly protein CpaC